MIIDWEKIDTVLLDMDGTLLDLHYDTFYWIEYLPKLYAKRHQLKTEEAKKIIEPLLAAKYGQLEWYSTDYWSKEFDIDIAKTKTDAEVISKIAFRENAENFLHRLKDTGKQIWLVTNADQHVLKIKRELLVLDSFFERLVSTHDFGLAKENPDFWPSLNQTFPFDPAKSLFVDDSLPILRVARNYGIEHLRAISRPDSKKPQKDTEEFSPLFLEDPIQ